MLSSISKRPYLHANDRPVPTVKNHHDLKLMYHFKVGKRPYLYAVELEHMLHALSVEQHEQISYLTERLSGSHSLVSISGMFSRFDGLCKPAHERDSL